jgi:hypothetical protein
MPPEPQSDSPQGRGPPPLVRSILSLLLFIHFFCVLVVLSSTYIRSRLQGRLVAIFGPYTELLALDPGTPRGCPRAARAGLTTTIAALHSRNVWRSMRIRRSATKRRPAASSARSAPA